MKKRTLLLCALVTGCAALGGATAFADHSPASESLGTAAMPPASSFSARVDN